MKFGRISSEPLFGVRRVILMKPILFGFLLALTSMMFVVHATANPKFAAVTVDARTGSVLFAENMDETRYPASLTKMMTLYLLFEEMNAGRLKLNSPIKMSARAAGMAPSKLGVKPGGSITVETAIRALVVKSANDVAAAVAERISGSEKAFAQRMTNTARALGMSRTTFANASGLPNPRQITTARDMATLGLRLMRDFPQYYPYFRTRSFVYAGRTITGHNRLLGSYDGTDGIKTGFINASGFNLVSSVRRGDKRLVGVVMGGRTGASRDAYMKKMLSRYFSKAKGGKTIAAVAGSAKGGLNIEEPQSGKTPNTASAGAAGQPKPPKPLFKKKSEQAAAADSAQPEPDTALQGSGSDPIGELAAEVSSPEKPAAQNDARAQPATEQVETVPKPSAEPQSTDPANVPFEVKTPAEQLADQSQVASITPTTDPGWMITLGDYATKNDAQAVIQLMRKRAPEAVDGKTAQTVMVEKDGNVTFRARFTGFDETTAAAACKRIKRQNTPCQAVGPS